MGPRVYVIGAGVIGISTALRVTDTCPTAEVTLIAEKFSPETTSDVAGGFWEPHLLGDTPEELVREYSSKTFHHIESLAHSDQAASVGAFLVSGYLMTAGENEHHAWWNQVYGYRNMTEDELKQYPDMKNGVFYTTVKLESTLYLDWLMQRFIKKGGKCIKKRVNTLDDLVNDGVDVIVNCTGVGAYHLENDHTVQPVRGQLIRVRAPWVKNFTICVGERDLDLSYVLPGQTTVVMGGTQNVGDWNTTVDAGDKQRIWDNCCKYVPSLKAAEYDSDWVGLRPARPSIRLETEYRQVDNRTMPIVHNYGHGGSGVTLHWGCAERAARLVEQALQARPNVASKL